MPLFERITKAFRPQPPMPVAPLQGALPDHPLLLQARKINQLYASEFGDGRIFTRFAVPSQHLVLNGRSAEEKIPGSVLYFGPHDPKVKNIIIGDGHANLLNFNAVLAKYLPMVERGEANLIFLGDLLHNEHRPDVPRGSAQNYAHLKDMTQSVEILSKFMEIKLRFPERIHLVRGDHEDARDQYLYKGHIPSPVFQGLELAKKLSDLGGPALLDEVQKFFENLPYLAIFGGERGFTIAGHSPIVKQGHRLDEAIAARFDTSGPKGRNPYVFNRPLGYQGQEDPAEIVYNDQDVQAMIEGLLNSDPQRLGMVRPLTRDELKAVQIITGHIRKNDQDVFPIEGFTNQITALQSYLASLNVLEVMGGASLNIIKLR